VPTASLPNQFIAERKGAGAIWIGRVITLDHSSDHLAYLSVLPMGKMHLQELCDW
jgi:hypothetical protein